MIGYRADSDQVRIWVADGGSGFSADVVDRGVSSAGSTGVGLDIARRTAERHGGSLEIGTSDLGGAEVAFTTGVSPLAND